jgi:hypothetical protein
VPIGTAEFETPGFIPVANMPTPPQECQRHETSVTGGVFDSEFMDMRCSGLFGNAPCLFSYVPAANPGLAKWDIRHVDFMVWLYLQQS